MTHDTAILSLLEGALPETDLGSIRVVEREGPEPEPVPIDWRRRPRKRWPMRRLAKVIGVHPGTIVEAMHKDAELRRLMGTPASGRLSSNRDSFDDDAVPAIARRVLEVVKMLHWAPRLGLDACVRCGLAERPHVFGGKCDRCYGREKKAKRGQRVRAFPGAWDTVRGHMECVLCRRGSKDGVTHSQDGRCSPCDIWHRRWSKALTPSQYRTQAERRRRSLAKVSKGKATRASPAPRDRWVKGRRSSRAAEFRAGTR